MINEEMFIKINKYLKKRFSKELVANEVILFDTWGILSIDELYKNKKQFAKDVLSPKYNYSMNTYEFLRQGLSLTFCIAPITRDKEIPELWSAKVQERRIAVDTAIHEINKFKITSELPILGQKEQLDRLKILEPALTYLSEIKENNDRAILYECGMRKIDWILTGDKHFTKGEVPECLKKLSIGLLIPKEIDGIITKELGKKDYGNYENGKEGQLGAFGELK